MAKTTKKPKAIEPRVYVGPTLDGGALSHLTVFRGDGYPANVAKVLNDRPVVRNLIVPVSQLAESVKAVQTKGHVLNTIARQLTR